jgi:hypothetical protein
MAARSATKRFGHPYPVVVEACINALPTHGFRLRSADETAGVIEAERGWSRWSFGEVLTIHVGADDSTATSVVVDSSLKSLGFATKAHPRNFADVYAALESYLSFYYGRV